MLLGSSGAALALTCSLTFAFVGIGTPTPLGERFESPGCQAKRGWNQLNREQRILWGFRAQRQAVAFSGSTTARAIASTIATIAASGWRTETQFPVGIRNLLMYALRGLRIGCHGEPPRVASFSE